MLSDDASKAEVKAATNAAVPAPRPLSDAEIRADYAAAKAAYPAILSREADHA